MPPDDHQTPASPPVAHTSDEEKDIPAAGRPLLAMNVHKTKAPSLPHASMFPCTPGARLPLEDLIGNCDEPDDDDGQLQQLSPQEQLGWVPNSSSDRAASNERKRKRAKSSSPTCPTTNSQHEKTSTFLDDNGLPFTAKKTPSADPVADLWQRYANTKQIGGNSPNPSDMNSSLFNGSPRHLETPVKSGPFRRWASTGNDWPSTKKKRRCIDSGRNIAVWQDQSTVDARGKSKVASMVQKIQEDMATHRLESGKEDAVMAQNKPNSIASSSSPLPDVGTEALLTPGVRSPLRMRHPNVASPRKATGNLSQKAQAKTQLSAATLHSTQSGGQRFENSRPSGNPLILGASGPLHLQSKAPLPAYKRPSITRAPSQPKVPQPPLPQALPLIDEFDDDDFDLTADDLNELFSPKPLNQRFLYETPEHPGPLRQQQPFISQRDTGQQVQPAQRITIDVDDDEFGDNDLDEYSFIQAELSATQGCRMSSQKRSPWKSKSLRSFQAGEDNESRTGAKVLQRYIVKQIVEGTYNTDKGHDGEEKVLLAEEDGATKTVAITLRGSWFGTQVYKHDIIHVAKIRRNTPSSAASSNVPAGHILITDDESSPFLVVHPDHMLSATTVADSFDCIRKAVLQDRVKATGAASKAMVYGKILHETFQQALSANRWDDAFLSALVERTVQAHVEGLWELGMRDTNIACEEVKAKMGEMSSWASVFVAEKPSTASLADEKQGGKIMMSISKLIAIEEHIWSPRYGLKGNVDATVQTTLLDDPFQQTFKNTIVPFEVKTGRTTQSPAHRAQTALYTLLLSDRYDVDVEAGILYYLESSCLSRVAPPIMEVRQMVQQRNRLASIISQARHPPRPTTSGCKENTEITERILMSQELEESGLPGLLKNPYKCGRCYAQQSCFTYHALVEKGSAGSAGLIDDWKKNHSLVWREAVGHLVTSAQDGSNAEALRRWFKKWDRLLTFEEDDQSKFRRELWTTTSTEREILGRCFGNLVLEQDLTSNADSPRAQAVEAVEGGGGKINRFTYAFERADPSIKASFAEGSQLTTGEPIVVSSEQGQWAIANGYVVAVSRHRITVAVDRKIGDSRQRLVNFDEQTNQSFRGTMTVCADNRLVSCIDETPTRYRIDKDEFSNGLSLIRNNLVSLMDTHPIHTRLRGQVILGGEPSFTLPSTYTLTSLQPTQLGSMNEDQQAAVSKVLSARDYALILGMPGTGKTTTIAHIIRALLAQNQSILLTSFTHTAVDNILLKIRDIAPAGGILRLGVPAKIDEKIQTFCQLAATPRTTIEEIDAAFMGTQIVATTCMGINHALFSVRTFDVCIVDEASQITIPTILGPLLKARKFVLVGDHFQLPPLVRNKVALEGGLDMSLFRQLSEEHPNAVVTLGRQYRMCEEIMTLSNELIYHGQLKCGDDQVAERTLQLKDPTALGRFHRPGVTQNGCRHDGRCWLAHATDPRRKVIYANTDMIGKTALETLSGGKNILNQVEATLSAQLVTALISMGVPAREIGVITLYRSQLALMRQLYRRGGIPNEVEIDSADRFQGRDKECIVLSMVRSNEAGIVGDLLKDWRRVNVAFTRARSKLIVLGSRRTLKNNELLDKFLGLVDERQWSMDLANGADANHVFDFSTQVTQDLASAPASQRRGGNPGKTAALSTRSSQSGPNQTQRRPLQASQSAANRRSSKGSLLEGLGRHSPKRIAGTKTSRSLKSRRVREQVAVEIFEDLTGEAF